MGWDHLNWLLRTACIPGKTVPRDQILLNGSTGLSFNYLLCHVMGLEETDTCISLSLSLSIYIYMYIDTQPLNLNEQSIPTPCH